MNFICLFLETYLLRIRSLNRSREILTVPKEKAFHIYYIKVDKPLPYHSRRFYKLKSPGSSLKPVWLYHQMSGRVSQQKTVIILHIGRRK